MQRHVLKITSTRNSTSAILPFNNPSKAALDLPSPTRTRSSPLSRSPLSPISAPNELMHHKKSIRQVALERRQKLAAQHSLAEGHIPPTPPSIPRRKLWGRRHSERPGMGEDASTPIERRKQFKWVRGQEIGKGTHGRVYLGLNATTGEMIAVKQITFFSNKVRTAESSGHLSTQTLKREIENMNLLHHPNMVEYLGLEEEDESLTIFMEYVPGRSVQANILKYGAFGDNVVKWFTIQILHGLEYLHARGIIHGELKSSNILVDPMGVCKIEGLGCSESEPRDNSRAVPRAVFWSAPEIIRTQYKAYTRMADIWSLGCIVLEMCTGRRPWSELEAVAVMFKLYHQTFRPCPPADATLHPGAEDFMEKCLALDPAQRTTAVKLRQHHYLILSPTWSFSGF
ncbi:kinase-like protein [Mycena maculata]|uniref:Kinase-like protein n=1 Tax=Mycena maculata TaxID=230809 RepID=A0AAD7NDR9_9AGAR|nr:kinase-like protein [Mycena maculata]